MQGHGEQAQSESPIDRAIERARQVLPDQGPIGVFVHHNTLHAFQHLPFHEAVVEGARLLGARPYLPHDEFVRLHHAGRIEAADVDASLSRALGDRGSARLALGVTRGTLWRALMLDDIDVDDAEGLAFVRRHTPGAEHPLLLAAEARLARVPRRTGAVPAVTRHRDALLALGAGDTDTAVHAELIRLSAVYLDHGQALQRMPRRELGFVRAVTYLFEAGMPEPRACPGVRDDLRQAATRGSSARDLIESSLQALGVDGEAAEDYLLRTALALPGWTGMFSRLERHPEEHAGEGTTSLEEFLAVRLVHDRRAIESSAKAAGLPVDWPTVRALAARPTPRPLVLDAWQLAGVARRGELAAEEVATVTDTALQEFWGEVDTCSRLARERVWQEAYEGRYRRQVLDALAASRRDPPAKESAYEPLEAQFIFCIDEREESIRRAIDEQPGNHETFGVAGFFGIAIDYQGLDDKKPAAYCPVVVTPQHEVHEGPLYTDRVWHQARAGLRARWQAASRGVHTHSRTLSGGVGLSFLLGPLAAVTAVARILAPRSSLALRDRLRDRFVPRPSTRLSSLRDERPDASDSPRGKQVGFALDEAADRVAGVLRNIGLIRDFAPVVIVLGHGSTSLNNPHESAHDCGACGGRRGGANARLFADMANRLEVRAAVRARGIDIPLDTWFVGALHDTADDSVRYADLERLPATHMERFDRAHATLDAARGEAAAERARRFDDAPLGLSPNDALRHVQARASHLAQPRPEYGHCTNASCVVGRRTLTRGVHLDRRAFLVSYDPSIDVDNTILERILAAVGPVGAGISLEYYFSSVDNEVYGCGTKLPHNVTGLIGVMTGHQSDLRTGLPLQMVELHEPMRLLLIVEATPQSLLQVAGRQPEVRELVVNEWVQLVSVDPFTGAMTVFQDGGFVPFTPTTDRIPEVHRSVEWHGGARSHLAPALIRGARARSSVPSGLPH